jgi:hypothetical protein
MSVHLKRHGMGRRRHNGRRVLRLKQLACAATVAAAWLLGLAGPALAHHSFAMFDTANTVTLAGTVTAFDWTNPHSYIEVDVTDDKGGIKHWSIELGSTSILQRGGWKFTTIKKGDRISAVVAPLRSGEPGSLLVRVTLPDGRVLGNGGPTGIGGGVPPPATPAPAR